MSTAEGVTIFELLLSEKLVNKPHFKEFCEFTLFVKLTAINNIKKYWNFLIRVLILLPNNIYFLFKTA
jgi:hypothetical protein